MTKSELISRLAAHFPQLVASDAELAVKMILAGQFASAAGGGTLLCDFTSPRWMLA